MSNLKIVIVFLMLTSNLVANNYRHLRSDATEFKKCFDIQIVPLQEILNQNSEIKYIKYCDALQYQAQPFSIEPLIPNTMIFQELFILCIPHGVVQSKNGYVFHDGKFAQEFVWADQKSLIFDIKKIITTEPFHIPGRVLVLAQNAATNYYHMLTEILARLAMVELSNIEYDKIYIDYFGSNVQKLLTVWGIPVDKIIAPSDDLSILQADELIIPSLVLNTNRGFKHCGGFYHPMLMQYVKQKLLSNVALLQESINVQLSDKIFISRKDAPSRRILNEDEIFKKLFEPLGFVRYELSKLTVAEQITLFKNAKIVVGEHGAGLANIFFCSKQTVIVELFQALIDSSYWWIADVFGLRYAPFKLLDRDMTYVLDSKSHEKQYIQAWKYKAFISAEKFKPVINFIKNIL